MEKSEDRKALENPGADAWFKKPGGPAGLPCSAFRDGQSGLIVNSKSTPGGNIGHPLTPAEVDWFVAMMKNAAPAMAATDLKTIEHVLRSQPR
jgi:hypothetical protein